MAGLVVAGGWRELTMVGPECALKTVRNSCTPRVGGGYHGCGRLSRLRDAAWG